MDSAGGRRPTVYGSSVRMRIHVADRDPLPVPLGGQTGRAGPVPAKVRRPVERRSKANANSATKIGVRPSSNAGAYADAPDSAPAKPTATKTTANAPSSVPT